MPDILDGGYRARMALRLQAVTYDARDPGRTARFWAGLLARDLVEEPGSVLLPGNDTQVGLRFLVTPTEKGSPNRLHLHLTSTSRLDQQRTVESALRLGGRHHDVGQSPDDDFVVLADPDGNELCVIGPGNTFLAGTGRLGEVTCDGTRQVGLFWRDALSWPLVWDQNEETAVQSPLGGTKVSWGGPPVKPKTGRNRQRFDLTAADPTAEAERLITLGAAMLSDRNSEIDLADPGGNEFCLSKA